MTDAWSRAIDAGLSYLRTDGDAGDYRTSVEGVLRAALASMEADGWVLVPPRPTLDMAVSGLYAADRDQHHPAAMADRYQAMIAARPPFPESK